MKKYFKILLLILFIILLNFLFLKIKKPSNSHGANSHDTHSGHLMEEKKEAGKQIYYCPMHPSYTSPKAGTCPICGMDLVQKKEEKHEEKKIEDGGVFISPQKQQLIGVKTSIVGYVDMIQTVRAKATVEYDERKIFNINTKLDGWIENLYVNYTGAYIKKGQPLFSLYSQDLVAGQEEFLLALKNKKIAELSNNANIKASSVALIDAARKRLRYLDISEEQINNLESTGEIKKTLTIYSPYSGFVIEKMAVEGIKIMPGEMLYKIADISSLWVIADIYEQDISLIKLGQSAEISFPSVKNKKINGKVSYIYPYLENETRTVKVRIDVANEDFNLKPNMFANVNISTDLGNNLSIPDTAVIDTGERQVVILSQKDGYFKPIDVKIGAKSENFYEVVEGVSEGDQVVVNANFLVDSESSMKSALSGMEHAH